MPLADANTDRAKKSLLRRIWPTTVCAIVLCSIAVLSSQSWIVGQSGNKQEDQAVTESFLRDTTTGQAIRAYLHCIDFDCFALESKIVKSGNEALRPLIALLQHGVPLGLRTEAPGDIRPRVIRLLSLIRDSSAIGPLVKLLKDDNPTIRAAAVNALGQMSPDTPVGALLPLLRDADELVRETTANSLSKLGRKEALSALREASASESKPHVKKAIGNAIESIEKH